MGLHEVATVAGVTEACRYNDHSMCNNPACGCDCHKKAVLAPPIDDMTNEAKTENACPKCGVKRPANEQFCRIDGTRLTSLACGMCGRGMNPEDMFCFNCGAPKGTVGKVTVPQIVVAPEPTGEFEQSVLRGLQEELANVDTGNNPNNQGVVQRDVVEQPGGPQGTFKLVSQPNPNKIRVPAKPAVRPAIRLPVKPS